MSSPDEVVPVERGVLKMEQETDEVIGPVRGFVLSGTKPSRAEWGKLSVLSKILMRSFKNLKMHGGFKLYIFYGGRM